MGENSRDVLAVLEEKRDIIRTGLSYPSGENDADIPQRVYNYSSP